MRDATQISSVPRGWWFGAAFLLLTINGAARLAATAIADDGAVSAALNLFGISAIVWIAAAAGAALAFAESNAAVMSRGDRLAVGAALVVMVVPFAPASAAALTGLALWALLKTPRDQPLRRSAEIFLAITGSLLWGRALLALGSDTLLGFDGAIVGFVSGTGGAANVVRFAGDAGAYYVAPGCSSLQGISLAIILWATVMQYFDVPLTFRALATLAATISAAIAANVLRLAAIATWPTQFDTLHVGFGATLFGYLGLILMIAAVALGLRHALFTRPWLRFRMRRSADSLVGLESSCVGKP